MSLKKDCVMNMTVLRHECKGGCILTFYFTGSGGGGGGILVRVDLHYVFASPLSEAHMGSRHCTVAAVL